MSTGKKGAGTAPKLPEGAHTEFDADMSYGDYLRLEALLACQRPRSDHHDEMLFIVIHQATELWLKLVLHELEATVARIWANDLSSAFKMLARVSRVQSQLIQSWDVLSTLTPADYMAFRGALGQASGFQSYQYRAIEFILGNKNRTMLEPHRHDAAVHDRLARLLEAPGLYDETVRLLARRGFDIDQEHLARDWSEPYAAHDSVRDAWLAVYRDPVHHWELYELAEELVDLDDWFQQWRFRHATTVERIIGHKRGTGGTAGVAYLKQAVGSHFFPELWDLRTAL
ncbi:MAG: tryptophan 2,3-dioxygenase [Alphaproteobacteria bacterium]